MLFFCAALFAQPAQAEFGAHLGSHFEFGSMGGEAANVYESRSMGAFGLQAMPGYRLLGKSVLAGLMLDLRFFSQLSSGTTVEFGGKSFLLGPAVAYEGAKIKFLLGWDLRARHSTGTPAATYKGSGIRVLLGYRLGARLWGDLVYVTTKYKMVSNGDAETSLEDNPIKSSMIGFGLSYSY